MTHTDLHIKHGCETIRWDFTPPTVKALFCHFNSRAPAWGTQILNAHFREVVPELQDHQNQQGH